MTAEDRAEANANRVLWCVHVLGPDDVHPAGTHAEAVRRAEELNRYIWSSDKAYDDILSFAYADVWPWTPEAHAKALAEDKAP